MRKVGLSRFADVSMYTRAVSALLVAFLALSVVSCGMGLEPARSEGAVVSLSVTTIPGYESGRAVAPVSSFLYIRMLGGPDGMGAKGYYGPYSLSIQTHGGALFTTKDIPAGDYSGMAVMMSASKIDEKQVTVDENSMTMAQVFALPDAEFTNAVTKLDELNFTLLDRSLDNLGSYGITNALTIRANQVNPVSVTLRPATTVSTSAMNGVTFYNEADPFRSFARLADLKAIDPSAILEGQTAMVKVTVQNTDGGTSINLKALAFYTESGALIPGSTLVSKSVAQNSPLSVTFPWDGNDSCFFYVEAEGIGLSLSFNITFPQTPPTGGFPVTVTNIPVKYEGWEAILVTTPTNLDLTYWEGLDEDLEVLPPETREALLVLTLSSQENTAYLVDDLVESGVASGGLFTQSDTAFQPVVGTTYYSYLLLSKEEEYEILYGSSSTTTIIVPLWSGQISSSNLTINASGAVSFSTLFP